MAGAALVGLVRELEPSNPDCLMKLECLRHSSADLSLSDDEPLRLEAAALPPPQMLLRSFRE
jgi:hypothetical protein